jgi:hypothetical protein
MGIIPPPFRPPDVCERAYAACLKDLDTTVADCLDALDYCRLGLQCEALFGS